jgi:hypothetical protein
MSLEKDKAAISLSLPVSLGDIGLIGNSAVTTTLLLADNKLIRIQREIFT